MLGSSRWSTLGRQWDDNARQKLNLVWHNLDGICVACTVHPDDIINSNSLGWPDASKGLHGMKKNKLVVVLSNGNLRLLADMVRAYLL